MRFWDGVAWTEHTAPPPPPGAAAAAVPIAGSSPYTPAYVQPNVKQGRDRTQYSRPQTGHSLLKHIFLGAFVAWIPTIYYAISPNHYFHL